MLNFVYCFLDWQQDFCGVEEQDLLSAAQPAFFFFFFFFLSSFFLTNSTPFTAAKEVVAIDPTNAVRTNTNINFFIVLFFVNIMIYSKVPKRVNLAFTFSPNLTSIFVPKGKNMSTLEPNLMNPNSSLCLICCPFSL
jgi:hypothetical protein